MSDPRFEFRGDLATTPFAEVLQTVHHYKVPGVVSVSRQGVTKKIYIWKGDVIFASSTDREDSLGNFLERKGRISKADLDLSVKLLLAPNETRRHGEVLVGMGLLTPKELTEWVTEQVLTVVYSVFEWPEGEVTFAVGQYRTDEIVQLSIPTRQAILAGVKQVRDVARLVNVLGPRWTVFDPCYNPADLGDVGLDVGEARFLQAVDGTKTFRDLVVVGPGDAAHNARLLYAFHALKLIRRRDVGSRSAIRKIQWRTDGGGFSEGS